ncbi:hypothetical protein GCM10010420_39390 [Streptomyces glaucosporus]|uniref:Integral membrane protein n=1 Tax=Streptomyces glaucosporus TaxID=284044 RepID=A0ABP5VMW8_9ACTN
MSEHVHHADCGCYSPHGNLPVHQPTPLAPEAHNAGQVPQVVHVHQAPPDRTVQRVALGAGIGGGMTAGAVYFGPLLTAALTSMAISLAVVALVVVVSAWAVVTVVRSVGGPEGQAAAKAIGKARKRR